MAFNETTKHSTSTDISILKTSTEKQSLAFSKQNNKSFNSFYLINSINFTLLYTNNVK